MKLGLRRGKSTESDAEEAVEAEVVVDAPAARTQSWTYGTQMGTKVIFGLMVASVAAGPIGFYLGLQGQDRAYAAADYAVELASAQRPDPAIYVAAERAGQETVEAWLMASRADHGWLDQLLPGNGLDESSLPVAATEYSAIIPTAVKVGADGLWQVTVAASVNENVALEGQNTDPAVAELSPWPRRYYQVPVQVDLEAGIASPVGLPAPVGAPASAGTLLGYTYDFGLASEIPTTISSFLGALLTGAGEVDRYLTPGSVVDRLSTPAYLEVKVVEVRADVTPDSLTDPRDGDTVRVRASVALTRPDGQSIPASYLLDLTSRSGRWEITSLTTTGTNAPEGDLS